MILIAREGGYITKHSELSANLQYTCISLSGVINDKVVKFKNE